MCHRKIILYSSNQGVSFKDAQYMQAIWIQRVKGNYVSRCNSMFYFVSTFYYVMLYASFTVAFTSDIDILPLFLSRELYSFYRML